MSFTTTTLSLRISDWISGRRGPEHGEVLLDRKRVYILPTTAGTVFAAAMLVLLIGSINYGLQLGFMLTFLERFASHLTPAYVRQAMASDARLHR
jgi:hypothetical protein